MYEASITLLIDQAPASSLPTNYNALLTSRLLARTYAELLFKRPVLEEARNVEYDRRIVSRGQQVMLTNQYKKGAVHA